MAKSKILQDITGGNNIESVMKRLYVIMNDLDDMEMTEWIKKELYGYEENDNIPEYRQIMTCVMGSYDTVGYGKIWSYKDRVLPTIGFDKETLKGLEHKKLFQPFSTLITMRESFNEGKQLTIPLPVETYPLFEKGTNLQVTNAYINIDKTELEKVINKIENKVLDLIIYLEKKFGNLDEFDIEIFDVNKKELIQIAKNCKKIIYENCTIQSFDNAKFKVKNFAIGSSKIENNEESTKNKNSNVGQGSNSIEKHTDIKANLDLNLEKKRIPFWKKLLGSKKNR